jgi:hypothetical protein
VTLVAPSCGSASSTCWMAYSGPPRREGRQGQEDRQGLPKRDSPLAGATEVYRGLSIANQETGGRQLCDTLGVPWSARMTRGDSPSGCDPPSAPVGQAGILPPLLMRPGVRVTWPIVAGASTRTGGVPPRSFTHTSRVTDFARHQKSRPRPKRIARDEPSIARIGA